MPLDVDFTGQTVHIVYHGGCPDGCLAAYIMAKHVNHAAPASLELHPTSHGVRNADKVTGASIAVFVDTSPTLADEPQLRKCKQVIIVDHHETALRAQKHLQNSLPSLLNLSNCRGSECGASLVSKFCGGASPLVEPWIIHLFHRLDVFQHQLPEELVKHFNDFKGFITQRGLGRCTVDLVEEMLADVDKALAEGKELYPKLFARTHTVFETRKLAVDSALVSVWVVELTSEQAVFMDLEIYQELINQLACSKALVFATLNRTPQENGLWTVGLRRAGECVDVGTLGHRLGACVKLNFQTGGGHAYAAGASCKDLDLSAELISKEIAIICEGILVLHPR
jgi:hypothetical protein